MTHAVWELEDRYQILQSSHQGTFNKFAPILKKDLGAWKMLISASSTTIFAEADKEITTIALSDYVFSKIGWRWDLIVYNASSKEDTSDFMKLGFDLLSELNDVSWVVRDDPAVRKMAADRLIPRFDQFINDSMALADTSATEIILFYDACASNMRLKPKEVFMDRYRGAFYKKLYYRQFLRLQITRELLKKSTYVDRAEEEIKNAKDKRTLFKYMFQNYELSLEEAFEYHYINVINNRGVTKKIKKLLFENP